MTKRRSDVVALGLGVTVPPLITLSLVPFREVVGATNVALLLMAVVVGVAATGRRAAAIAAAVSSALCFDFFHTQPFNEFRVARREDVISMVLLVLAGLIVVEVARWGRRQQSHAERTITEVSAVRAMAEMVATGEDPDFVVMSASFWLRDLLHLRDCRFDVPGSEPPPAELHLDGTVTVGPLRWATATQGLPGPEVHLPVRHGQQLAGYFVLVPTPGEPVSEDRLFTAAAIADQVGTSFAAHRAGR